MAKPTAVKVSVQCPHCGAHQLEPALAQSTYCRACSEHFEIGVKNNAHHEDDEGPGIWEKFSGLFRDNTPRVVSCFECGTRQEVVRTATSCSCKSCGAYIDLQDVKIDSGFSRAIQTAGHIFVSPKGDLYTARAICGSADLRGSMRGQLVCTGEISVKYKGRITGGIETDILRVAKKSTTEFVRPLRARDVFIEGEMSGRILASGTVHILKSGRMTGSIYAKGINIERGGEFEGELNIGENQTEEPSLLPTPPRPPARRNDPQSELGLGLG
ncbi:MAG: polymer-forming cytoskeletal protein [Chthoniobacterales bacterium]